MAYKKLVCVRCNSLNFRKIGKYDAAGLYIQRYQCKACRKTQTRRTGTKFYRKKKQRYAAPIIKMYCEGMSLRGISRVLNLNYKTVYKYFLEAAYRAETAHSRRLSKGLMKTSFVQFDEMESIEHGKTKPLGIQLAVRPSTFEIISAKVGRIPIRALRVPKQVKERYSLKCNRRERMADMVLDIEKVSDVNTLLKFDNAWINRDLTKFMMPSNPVEIAKSLSALWRLNHICARLRNNVSRLRRRGWATTKRMDRLQRHLDLYIAYNNGYSLP